jgi:hypothetical protein
MRRVAVAAAIVVAGSCGSQMPASPDIGPSPSPRSVSVPAGPYTLTITPSNAGNSAPSICSGTLATTPVRLAVSAEGRGEFTTLQTTAPGNSLRIDFRITGASVLGGITGSAVDEGGHRVSANGEVTGAAPPDPAITVAGNINGQISAGDGFCSNNAHSWSLVAR